MENLNANRKFIYFGGFDATPITVDEKAVKTFLNLGGKKTGKNLLEFFKLVNELSKRTKINHHLKCKGNTLNLMQKEQEEEVKVK